MQCTEKVNFKGNIHMKIFFAVNLIFWEVICSITGIGHLSLLGPGPEVGICKDVITAAFCDKSVAIAQPSF